MEFKEKNINSGLSNSVAEVDVTIHIFSVSATLVGVCLTVLGIFMISRRLFHGKGFSEIMIVVDALFFLFSCFLSYLTLRLRHTEHHYRLKRFAEQLFFVALAFMVFISGYIIYELA
ncbi:MAG: hypothetical protein FWD70_06630 [Desulfuromonadales bacterium]|nr:hypothetical protein [Desulfuromonadales bacterium]